MIAHRKMHWQTPSESSSVVQFGIWYFMAKMTTPNNANRIGVHVSYRDYGYSDFEHNHRKHNRIKKSIVFVYIAFTLFTFLQ